MPCNSQKAFSNATVNVSALRNNDRARRARGGRRGNQREICRNCGVDRPHPPNVIFITDWCGCRIRMDMRRQG